MRVSFLPRTLVLAVCLACSLPSQAGLFDDDEARKAILDLRTRIDEGCMHAHDRLRRLAQRQRRPLGLAKRCTTALQLSAHATVQNYHRSLCHITSLKVLMNKIHYGD